MAQFTWLLTTAEGPKVWVRCGRSTRRMERASGIEHFLCIQTFPVSPSGQTELFTPAVWGIQPEHFTLSVLRMAPAGGLIVHRRTSFIPLSLDQMVRSISS